MRNNRLRASPGLTGWASLRPCCEGWGVDAPALGLSRAAATGAEQGSGAGSCPAAPCTIPSLLLLALDSFVVFSHFLLILEISEDECLPSQAINANKSIQRPWALAAFHRGLALLKDDCTHPDASPFKPQCPQDHRPPSLPLSAAILLTQPSQLDGVSLAAPSAAAGRVTRIAVDRGSGCAQGMAPFKR